MEKGNYQSSAPPQPPPNSSEAAIDNVDSDFNHAYSNAQQGAPTPYGYYPSLLNFPYPSQVYPTNTISNNYNSNSSPHANYATETTVSSPPLSSLPPSGMMASPQPHYYPQLCPPGQHYGAMYGQPAPPQLSPPDQQRATMYGQPAPPQLCPPDQQRATMYAPPAPTQYNQHISVYGQPPLMPMYDQQVVMPVAVAAPILINKHAEQLQNFIFLGTNGKIRALEAIQGAGVRTVWTEELKGCGFHMIHLILYIARGHLYAAMNGHIFCFDALTGKTIWKAKPELKCGIVSSDLVTILLTYDGSILVSAANGTLVAFNATTGENLWQISIDGFTGLRDSYALVEHRGILYVGNEGFVRAYFMINGQLKWKNALKGGGYCPISLAAYAFSPPGGAVYDILYVGTEGYILALDGQTGATRNQAKLDGTGYKPVAMLLDPPTDTLYTATSGELRCFRADNLTQLWKSNLPGMNYSLGHSLIFTDSEHIAIGMHGTIGILNKRNPKLDRKISLRGCGYHLVTLASMPNPNQFVVASSGKLFGSNRHGGILWEDGLPGMGYAEVCVSTATYNTDFNSTTIPQSIEVARRDRKRNNNGD